jgi:signal transduction histidine kinase
MQPMGDRKPANEAMQSAQPAPASWRQRLARRLIGNDAPSTELQLEQFFRAARELEAQPEHGAAILAQLLTQIYKPTSSVSVANSAASSQVLREGKDLLVPLSALTHGAGTVRDESLVLTGAQQGNRSFTAEDALMADRIVEQLRRTVAFDQAVESGRNEERLRLAQDLHDDIGARLLTLMYTASSPQTEDYVRLTLQDLKTLTRGLAVSNQLLSHAVAEWKSDTSQRLQQARIDLHWFARHDVDLPLGVVQWSAITRILRELITNAIAHAQARKLEVHLILMADRLEIVVADDGVGTNPEQWLPGLGTGGVRKRVRQLGGAVRWTERGTGGIECRVTVDRLSTSGHDRRS